MRPLLPPGGQNAPMGEIIVALKKAHDEVAQGLPGTPPPQLADLGTCPMGALHAPHHWAGDGRLGLSCRKCHKTWEWTGLRLWPTWA